MNQRIVVNPADIEDALRDYLSRPDEQAEVQQAACTYQAFPFWRDIGGCLFLRPVGTVWSMGWETPEQFEPVSDARPDRDLVHAAGSRLQGVP